MCVHIPGPMTCEMFIARAGHLKIKGTLPHDEYWAVVERHLPQRRSFVEMPPFYSMKEAPTIINKCPHNVVNKTCDEIVMSFASSYVQGSIKLQELVNEMTVHNSGMIPNMEQLEHCIKDARQKLEAEKPKTTIEYHDDGKYIPKMFQKKEPSVPKIDENIYDGITIETKEDGVRNTVTVNGEVCTFDPRLVIKIEDEEDGLKFNEAFKRYINCEIGTDSLRLVAADPKHYDSYGDAIPAVPKIKDDVNHPSHYNQYKGIEVIDVTEQLNFNRGNAVKYVARAGFKSEDTEVKDLEKALWYINREITNWKENGFEVPAWGSVEIMTLVGQMNFFRGSAVLHISRAGRPNFRGTELDELETGAYYIRHELERLKGYANKIR